MLSGGKINYQRTREAEMHTHVCFQSASLKNELFSRHAMAMKAVVVPVLVMTAVSAMILVVVPVLVMTAVSAMIIKG